MGPLIPVFRLLVTSPLGCKARVDNLIVKVYNCFYLHLTVHRFTMNGIYMGHFIYKIIYKILCLVIDLNQTIRSGGTITLTFQGFNIKDLGQKCPLGYVSLRLRVQNAVPAQPCVGKY